MKKQNLITDSNSLQTIYLARDSVFFHYKQCKNKAEAENFINQLSGVGFIEIYELHNDDYYYFKEAIRLDSGHFRGVGNNTVMGSQLDKGRVHKKFVDIILK